MKRFGIGLIIAIVVVAAVAEWYREREKEADRAVTYEAERILGKRPRLIDPYNDALLAEPTIQRFVSVPRHGLDGDLALDTQTGRLCRTWDWGLKEGAEQNGIDSIPTCSAMLVNDGEYIQRRAEGMQR